MRVKTFFLFFCRVDSLVTVYDGGGGGGVALAVNNLLTLFQASFLHEKIISTVLCRHWMTGVFQYDKFLL